MATLASPSRVTPLSRLWQRELDEYPTGGRRYGYLALVVLVTIVLYYQNYVAGAVATQLLGSFHVSFLTFALIIAGSNAVGAVASLASGIADKIGRANLAVYGLVICSLITLVWIPNTTTATEWGIATAAAGPVEGVILVATPALVRDFSPQVGRAQAMAFWTMGPVLGSLIVTEVTSHTLDTHPRWQDQYEFAGWAGLAVALLAVVALRELNAAHRDRIVGALEAETQAALAARGLSHEEATRAPYRQMLKPDILLSSLAISIFLLFYYTAVGFLPVYFQTTLNFSASQANDLLNYLWAATAASMLLFGIASDRLRVRKPFMLAGGLLDRPDRHRLPAEGRRRRPQLQQRRDPAGRLRRLERRRLRAVDGQLHRDRRAAEPGPVGHRPGHLGLDPAHRRRRRLRAHPEHRLVGHAAGERRPERAGRADAARDRLPGPGHRGTAAPGRVPDAGGGHDAGAAAGSRRQGHPRRRRRGAHPAAGAEGPGRVEGALHPDRREGPAGAEGRAGPVADLVLDLHFRCDRLPAADLPDGGPWRPRPQQDHHAIDHALADANRLDHPASTATPSATSTGCGC